MSTLYIDPTALVLPAGGGPADPDEHLAPGVAEALTHLSEAGFDVTVVGDPVLGAALPEGVEHAAMLPEHLDHDEWFLTGEPNPRCGRPRGGRTVLVGPRRQPGRLPLPRFDMEARDLRAAAMEILSRPPV